MIYDSLKHLDSYRGIHPGVLRGLELLRDTDQSIDEISVAVGYLNTSSFRRKFKQATGMTPSQLRC